MAWVTVAVHDKTDQSWAHRDSKKGTILQKVDENDQTVYGSYEVAYKTWQMVNDVV